MKRWALTAVAVVWGAAVALPADPEFALKTEELAAPKELAAAIRDSLGKQAVTVSEKDGDARLTLWLRADVPAKANAEQVKNGLTYREIPEGELVGVVRFPTEFTDFRKQRIAAGVYTLRIAVQPETGDHKDTAPHSDFVLLTVPENDQSTDPVEPKTLYKTSAKINDGDHPAVMLLFPAKAQNAAAKVVKKADGVSVLETRLALDADGTKTAIGFAIAVAGYSTTR